LLSPTYGSAASSVGTANPYYVRFLSNGTTSVLAYAMSQKPTFFSYGLEMLGCLTGWDGTDPITPSAGAVVLVLMRHDAFKYTDVEGKL
jgi:hypothetical protein